MGQQPLGPRGHHPGHKAALTTDVSGPGLSGSCQALAEPLVPSVQTLLLTRTGSAWCRSWILVVQPINNGMFIDQLLALSGFQPPPHLTYDQQAGSWLALRMSGFRI